MRRLNALVTVLLSVALGALFEDKFLDPVNARLFGDRDWLTGAFVVPLMFACVVILVLEVRREKGEAS